PDYMASSPVLQRFADRCTVIPLGTIRPGPPPASRSDFRDLRLKYGERMILTVGRLVYYKGIEYLLDAMRSVDGTLVAVGDGPERPHLEQVAARHGVADRVVFVGNVEDLTPYYHAADVFAFPSSERSEAFGLVQVE